MRKLITVYLTLAALAACGEVPTSPPYAYPTPIVREIGADEAMQIVYDATSTAAAAATQAAHATATEVSARSTSTTAAQLTRDSVAVASTLSALDLTAGAGAALATDAAARRTQAAGQTATWAPPTLAALATNQAATAAARAQAQQRQQADEAFWRAIREAAAWALLCVGVLFLLALGAAVAFGVSDLFSARAELLRADAARAQAEAAQLLVMQYGGALLQLAGQRWELMPPPGAQGAIAAPLSIPPADGGVHEVPIRVRGDVISSIPVGPGPETPERERVIHLLRQAVAVAGPAANYVPSAALMNMHPMDWQKAVDLLKFADDHPAYVVTSPGRPKAGQVGRTRLAQPAYKTLAALLDGVRRGDVLPRPQEALTAPAAGNLQNAHSEGS